MQILGSLRLWQDGVEQEIGPPQQAYVLALLLARAGRPVTTDDLIDLVWGEDAPYSALNILHKYVGTLRRLLEPALSPRETGSYLIRRGNGYQIAVGPDELDLARFRMLVRAAHTSRAAGRPHDALDQYVDALRLWNGSTADALMRGSAAMSIAAALDGEFYAACGSAAGLAAALRQPDRVLPALRLAGGMAPLHEQVQASLITTLAADGQQAEALAAFRVVRDRLADDLGIDPGQALREAHRRVLDPAYGMQPVPGEDDRAGRPVAVPPALVTRPAQLPPDLPTFAGRANELATLTGLLAEVRASPLIVGLDGMGGVGKSALATHFAHLVADEFADGQLHLDLRGRAAGEGSLPVEEALRALLTSLGMPESRVPATVEGRIGAYRSLIAGRRILLLLDDARDVAQVRPLLPSSARSMVLVSSRSPLIGLAALDGADLMHIELPDAASARALFRRRLERSPNRSTADLAAEAEVVDEIVELCGRFPLALAILAARLSARPRLSLAAVAAELRHGLRSSPPAGPAEGARWFRPVRTG
ncbi:AfsR/SARP family transcriptional regulator [Actinoplanes subtropicus]|uniref:AfsR/SARP family transcriptional regulator n=1 Tax=Actinoplanes subtropicus TaxID=543632 RepID=UPI00068FD502|nr:AfsR/SARP family transcriptional regulator [Actinoplanes subtropicus]